MIERRKWQPKKMDVFHTNKCLFWLCVLIGNMTDLLYASTIYQNTFSVERSFILNPHQNTQSIEFFIAKPEGNGPFPVVFLLHGHQIEPTSGGKQFIDMGWMDPYFVKEGIVVVAISIPGFGNSDGKRDFSGPDSQQAVASVIEYFSQLPFIDVNRMGIYGISKGSTLASMVHLYYPHLLFQILEAGWYDLTSCSALMPDYLEKIKQNILEEVGTTQEALVERSAIFHTKPVHAKTLILAGEFDDRRTVPSALALHELLISEGKESVLKIFPNELHVLSADKWDTILPFMRQTFFDLYGIGVKFTLIMPAIHVAKIHPGSSAEKNKKLKVGDVILRISPNHDAEEIDVLRMPISQFVSLITGKKGTSLRLYVQHFDQTYEEIVIERMG